MIAFARCSTESSLGPSGQNFLVLMATLSFALFCSARAVDVMRAARKTDDDHRHLVSTAFSSLAVMVVSVMPMAMDEWSGAVSFSSTFLGLAVAAFTAHFLIELRGEKISIVYPRTTIAVVIGATLAMIVALACRGSIIELKCSILAVFVLLCVRFFLVLGRLAA